MVEVAVVLVIVRGPDERILPPVTVTPEAEVKPPLAPMDRPPVKVEVALLD